MSGPISTETPKTRCAVFVPVVGYTTTQRMNALDVRPNHNGINHMRAPEAQLEEACGLAEAINLDIVLTDITRVATFKPATLYGGGKVDELHGVLKMHEVDVTLVDHPLTPVQQRNLERAWNTKVLDRTGMILEIFGARAQTKEGRLQVDLAALRYQRGRLVRSWTHLERQRGGAGFLGGPGETQIESDRRELQMKIERLEKQLEEVRRTRSLHRKQRKKREIPIIAFVGYTNAGKSTLFNKMTKANVLAKDLLFATLDPTLRRIELPEGSVAVMSDTVGFISNLPTDLVAAFRSTLEEVLEADVIVHVRDISHDDTHAQADDVVGVLQDLGLDINDSDGLSLAGTHYMEVWNKADLLAPERRDEIRALIGERDYPPTCVTSAATGEGIADLLVHLETCLNSGQKTRTVTLKDAALGKMHFAYELGTVLDRKNTDEGHVILKVRSARWLELNHHFDL